MRNSVQTIALASMVAAGSLMGGCATTSHVGDDWQCPLVQGVPCQGVAEADPARAGTTPRQAAVAEGDERSQRCDGGCRPFGWLRRALAGGTPAGSGMEAAGGNGLAGGNALAGGDETAAATGASSGPGAESADPHAGEPNHALRLPEVVGRIWMAPWVDGEGVYHEGAWVRVVLQPARWKLP